MAEWPIGIHYIEHAEIDDTQPNIVIWCFLCGQFRLKYQKPLSKEYIEGMTQQWVEMDLDLKDRYIMRVVAAPGQRE